MRATRRTCLLLAGIAVALVTLVVIEWFKVPAPIPARLFINVTEGRVRIGIDAESEARLGTIPASAHHAERVLVPRPLGLRSRVRQALGWEQAGTEYDAYELLSQGADGWGEYGLVQSFPEAR